MQAWFHEVLGTRVFQDGVSSAETLRDGIILCKLMQALRPGSIRKFNAMKGAFFQLEVRYTPVLVSVCMPVCVVCLELRIVELC